jgi:hypothetical protein
MHPHSEYLVQRDVEHALGNKELYEKVHLDVERERLRCCSEPELAFNLALNNPVVFSFVGGGAIYALFRQVLRPWPEWMAQNLRYFSIPSAFMGALGFKIAAHSLEPSNSVVPQRVFFASLEGVAGAVPYTLGDEIEIFCQYHSQPVNNVTRFLNSSSAANITSSSPSCSLSDGAFIGGFVVPTLVVVGGGYAVWNTYSEDTKKRWAMKSKLHWFFVNATEVTLKTLLYGRIIQGFAMTVSPIAEPFAYEWAFAPAAATELVIKAFPQHEKKINTSIMYFMFGNLVYMLYDVIQQEFTRPQQSDEQDASALGWGIFKTVVFGGFAIAGMVFSIKKSVRYIREHQKIARYVRVRQDEIVVARRSELAGEISRLVETEAEKKAKQMAAVERERLQAECQAIIAEEKDRLAKEAEAARLKEFSDVDLTGAAMASPSSDFAGDVKADSPPPASSPLPPVLLPSSSPPLVAAGPVMASSPGSLVVSPLTSPAASPRPAFLSDRTRERAGSYENGENQKEREKEKTKSTPGVHFAYSSLPSSAASSNTAAAPTRSPERSSSEHREKRVGGLRRRPSRCPDWCTIL